MCFSHHFRHLLISMPLLFSHQPPVLLWTWVPPWCVTTTLRRWAGQTVLVQFPTKWQHSAEMVMSNIVLRMTQAVTYPTCTALRPTWSPSPHSPLNARVSTATHTPLLQVRRTTIIYFNVYTFLYLLVYDLMLLFHKGKKWLRLLLTVDWCISL